MYPSSSRTAQIRSKVLAITCVRFSMRLVNPSFSRRSRPARSWIRACASRSLQPWQAWFRNALRSWSISPSRCWRCLLSKVFRPPRLERSASSSFTSRRIEAYWLKSPKWHWAESTSSSIAVWLRRTWRSSPTTARSAWNCANDDSREPRARSRPKRLIKLMAMLYVGVNEERNG